MTFDMQAGQENPPGPLVIQNLYSMQETQLYK
ncbi:Uncharacterised protein [Mycobacteroides abscessus subsp. abscessus]|nr:Uncharacterised protein [Mycobacteroides abscessus subsp. abscessus]